MAEDPRIRRLRADYQRMVELKGRSDFIDFEIVDLLPSMPPEKYIVTFTCLGIASINRNRQPVYSEHHQLALYLDGSYPRVPPQMMWTTPIWHPNIQHKDARKVCIDATWWRPGRTLDDLVVMIGEMIQYKNYWAEDKPPYPLDREVAEWVRWAESQGIFGPNRPVDDRELRRRQRVRSTATGGGETTRPSAHGRIRIVDEGLQTPGGGPETSAGGRVKLID